MAPVQGTVKDCGTARPTSESTPPRAGTARPPSRAPEVYLMGTRSDLGGRGGSLLITRRVWVAGWGRRGGTGGRGLTGCQAGARLTELGPPFARSALPPRAHSSSPSSLRGHVAAWPAWGSARVAAMACRTGEAGPGVPSPPTCRGTVLSSDCLLWVFKTELNRFSSGSPRCRQLYFCIALAHREINCQEGRILTLIEYNEITCPRLDRFNHFNVLPHPGKP